MHELGIVFNITKQIDEIAKENKVNKVISLTVEVGEVSTVVPEYFKDCFEWAKKKTEYLKDCKLNLVVLSALSYCEDCKQTYNTVQYGKTCPHCKSEHTYLVTGNEVKMKQIEVE
ncbi:MAG: hydrogenase maturation nickel metallochaperone HypA [Clostridia bacterium]|nr:hydrogenase maturation nickel metallochaperone HypA [Clostridia bacterium]